jgi:hypothetical protein
MVQKDDITCADKKIKMDYTQIIIKLLKENYKLKEKLEKKYNLYPAYIET